MGKPKTKLTPNGEGCWLGTVAGGGPTFVIVEEKKKKPMSAEEMKSHTPEIWVKPAGPAREGE